MREHSSTQWAKYLVLFAALCIFVNLVEPLYRFARLFPKVFGSPSLFVYEPKNEGLSSVTLLGMLVVLRFSKTVVATLCCLFSFAGFNALMFYGWSEFAVDDLKWAVPFGLAGSALIVAIWLEYKLRDTANN